MRIPVTAEEILNGQRAHDASGIAAGETKGFKELVSGQSSLLFLPQAGRSSGNTCSLLNMEA